MKKSLGIIKLGGTTIAAGKNTEQKSYISTGNLITSKLDKYEKIVCVVSAYSNTTNRLEQKARDIVGSPDKRALDLLLSIGEQESAALLGVFLRSRGYKCEILTGWQAGIKTNNNAGKASVESIDAYIIKGLLQEVDIVIVTGFQGVSQSNQITTLGRGGSDTTAIALGVALGISNCEIITDVPGIFTTNPKILNSARLIPKLDFSTAMEMAASGADVIDSRAVELAKKYNYEFVVNHYNGNGSYGSQICNSATSNVCGVISSNKCVLIHVRNLDNFPGVFAKIIDIIGAHEVKIGFYFQSFSHSETTKCSFLLWESDQNLLITLIDKIEVEFTLSEVELQDDVVAISVIGRSIMEETGTAAKGSSVIESTGATILGISSSPLRLTYVVEDAYTIDCIAGLHEVFAREQ